MRTTQLGRQADPAAATPCGQGMMRAIVQDQYGTAPEGVLRLAQIARPGIAADEVDRGTWHLMAGQPYLMRILGFGFRGPKNPVPGLDAAGMVAAVGPQVTRFRPGD